MLATDDTLFGHLSGSYLGSLPTLVAPCDRWAVAVVGISQAEWFTFG
jgi:hypothetical protein